MGWLSDVAFNIFMFPLETAFLRRFRKSSVSRAEGNVLEIGVGTGVNLKYYKSGKIKSLSVLDQNIREGTIRSAGGKLEALKTMEIIEGDVENLPYPDNSFDTVVFTLVFCSVDNPEIGLKEVRRVLKDSGTIIFIEHVIPEGKKARAAVHKANAYWNNFTNGCNLNRNTLETIKNAGFNIIDSTYDRKSVFITGIGIKN